MILYYTDIQGDKYSRFDMKTKSGYGLRLDNIIQCADWISSQIRERKPRAVINGGDTYNSIGIVSSEVLSAMGVCISKITQACKEVGAEHIIILGNHDMGILSNAVTSVDHFGSLSEARIIREPEEFELEGKLISLIPYSHDKNFTSAALKASESRADLAFTHLDFNGFKFNNFKTSEAELNPNSFRKGFKIINGHYHIPQVIGNVTCVGSCIQHKYSEFSKKRGILWIDSDLNTEHIQNTVSPWLVKVNSTKELRELEIPVSSYVYIDYNPAAENLEELDAELNKYARIIINRSSASIKMKHIENKLKGDSPEEVLHSFITDFYETTLDKSVLLERGRELLNI